MACDQWLDAISADVDGEDPMVDRALLEAHLARCQACRHHRDQLIELRRRMQIQPADQIPDLSPRIVKVAAVVDRAGSWRIVRLFLAVVAIQIIVLSLPALLLGEEAGTSAHAARHLGAFSIAYAAGLLVVAVRPARARSILPVTCVLCGALVLGAVVDIFQGQVPLVGEATHIPEVVSAFLVWALAIPGPRTRRRSSMPRPSSGLRLVDDPDGGPAEEQAG